MEGEVDIMEEVVQERDGGINITSKCKHSGQAKAAYTHGCIMQRIGDILYTMVTTKEIKQIP